MYRQAVAFRFVQIPPGNKKTTPMGWFSYWRSSRDLNPGNTSMSYEISSSCKAGSLCPSLSLISANFPQLVTALLPLPRKMHGFLKAKGTGGHFCLPHNYYEL